MASAGPEAYSLSLKTGNPFQVGIPSGLTVPPLTANLQKNKAWYLSKQHLKPIWRLAQNHVTPLQNQHPVYSGTSSQHSCFLYQDLLCREAVLLNLPPSHLHPFPDFLGSALLYRRSYFRHKPYRTLESICLKSSTLEKQSHHLPPAAFCSVPNNAMSSSTMDPFLVPSTPGGHSSPVSKGFPLSSGKQNSSSYRPVLNNNSFLRPTSAKVPLQQNHHHQPLPPENKKLKGLSRQPGFSWTHSGGNGDWSGNLDRKLGKSSGLTLEHTGAKSCVPIHNSTVIKVDQSSWRVEDGENRSQNLKEQNVRLTEAMRKLTASGIRKVNTYNEFGHRIDSSCLMNANFHSTLFSRWKPHIVAQITPKEVSAAVSPNLEHSGRRQSLIRTEGAEICTKRINVRLLASDPEPSNHTTSSLVVNIPPVSSAEQVVKTELSPQTADEETTISSLQFGTDAKWGQPTAVKDTDSTLNLPLLDQADVEDIEEELPDGLEDVCSQDEEGEEDDEGESDGSSSTGLSPNGSVAIISRNCIEGLVPPLEGQERILKPALVCSLFPNVPPTIYFGTRDERVEKLPWEQRKMLRWKMSTVTPNIVKQAVGRSHFKVSRTEPLSWLISNWAEGPAVEKCVQNAGALWKEGVQLPTPVIYSPSRYQVAQEGLGRLWKPPEVDCEATSARGIGIQVIHKWNQLPKRRPLLVQRYLHKPYLIGGSKFDLRIYVYVTCYDPLRIYLFKDGLVRFASCKYSSSMKSLNNKYMHLTNYSINKKNVEYKANTDETACQGHKWALKALWSYLNQKGVDSEAIWEKIKDIVVKTIIASEPYITNLVKLYVRRPYCCHELFGFDVMLDENLKPWILEVNISPSLHSNSPLDVSIKGQMVRDVLNLAGFTLPNADDVASSSGSNSSTASLNTALKEKSRPSLELFTAEKTKKAYYLTQKVSDHEFYSTILDILTPDDVRVLIETEDEFARRGQFERIFPSRVSMRYLRFFEQLRYFNILVAQWELKYFSNRTKGVDLLRSWCYRGYHNGIVTDTTMMWTLPRTQVYLKNDFVLNGMSKVESGRISKALVQRDEEESSRSPETTTATQSLPLIKYAAGTLKKGTVPQAFSNSSLVK
ncbi:tubulin monoglutamylase TTLL4 isoform X2 [Sphaerodactylus townsendi]|uniref:tubulin monoglutamylase TTLL4 isoform X2 n=1 Tax=Sphaerodactylus townsendi TaxID=933632 RepID=UPI002026C2A4|nr:tubulin monoglutamylase TTLL4 isoform X2 [Sphaerodactylus townsendi]